MNWGYKILFVYVAFIAGILLLVFKSSTQKMDLVTTDYYAKELVYQQRIDEAKRTSKLSVPVTVTEKNSQLEIAFPKEFAAKKIKGIAKIYFPADENKDAVKEFETAESVVLMPVSKSNKGLYYVQVSWVADGLSYYFEQKIML